jgi:hypothetical protein
MAISSRSKSFIFRIGEPGFLFLSDIVEDPSDIYISLGLKLTDADFVAWPE